MPASRKIFLTMLMMAATARGDSRFDLRYQVASSRSNTSAYSAQFDRPIWKSFSGEIGGRLSTTLTDLDAFQYKGELSFTPLSFFRSFLRLHHATRLPETTATTHLLLGAALGGTILGPLGGFFEFGWYERFSRIQRALIIPTFDGEKREHDIAVNFGVKVQASRALAVAASVATFEEIEVYNLNNPFAELRAFYFVPQLGGEASLFFRYRLLLGFGRWDTLTAGAALTFPLKALDATGT